MLGFIVERLAAYRPVIRSAQLGDPVLNVLKLMDKLGAGLMFQQESRA